MLFLHVSLLSCGYAKRARRKGEYRLDDSTPVPFAVGLKVITAHHPSQDMLGLCLTGERSNGGVPKAYAGAGLLRNQEHCVCFLETTCVSTVKAPNCKAGNTLFPQRWQCGAEHQRAIILELLYSKALSLQTRTWVGRVGLWSDRPTDL